MPDGTLHADAVNERRANLALGLALAALVVMLVLGAADADGPIWLVLGALSAAAVFVGLGARGARLAGRPLAAVVLGSLLFIAFVVGTAAEFA